MNRINKMSFTYCHKYARWSTACMNGMKNNGTFGSSLLDRDWIVLRYIYTLRFVEVKSWNASYYFAANFFANQSRCRIFVFAHA